MTRYIATARADTVTMIDDQGEILWNINPKCPEWAAYQAWKDQGGELLPARPSEFHEFSGGQWRLNADQARSAIQQRNRAACRAHILARYPLETQASMNAGIYSAAETAAYQDFVAGCVAEENRVFDLLETAADPTAVEPPAWPEE